MKGVTTKATVLLAAAILLSACATRARYVTGPPTQLSDNDLCRAWIDKPANSQRAAYQSAVWQEIEKRKLFTAAQVEQIRDGMLEVGMPEAAAFCAWGRPRRSSIIRTKPSVINEFKYRRLSYEAGGAVSVYVYACNYVVTHIQRKRAHFAKYRRDCRSSIS